MYEKEQGGRGSQGTIVGRSRHVDPISCESLGDRILHIGCEGDVGEHIPWLKHVEWCAMSWKCQLRYPQSMSNLWWYHEPSYSCVLNNVTFFHHTRKCYTGLSFKTYNHFSQCSMWVLEVVPVWRQFGCKFGGRYKTSVNESLTGPRPRFWESWCDPSLEIPLCKRNSITMEIKKNFNNVCTKWSD
jgi:hypothetical protein